MDRGMGSPLPTEKLNRSNYASWSYKMHQCMLGHSYLSYVEGVNEVAPEPTHTDFPAREQASSTVLYCLASCVHDQMLDYIWDAKTLKEAWENLKKLFVAIVDFGHKDKPSRPRVNGGVHGCTQKESLYKQM